ncbi:MAG: sporulation integral membrane protein YtvI [Hydrogenibacillus schlegelii]|uniref:Sporulation integral membrane protein YtvI n=1 Tax=Hydrogenibacillus schlegelii TaxID=1484 RepID=A0A947GB97_HYDSH|nr:sporulation integral membrane protein YtvI [Hydrogenibacillus schlegelii]
MFEYYRKYARTIFDIAVIVFTGYVLMFLASLIFRVAKPIVYGLILYALIHPFVEALARRRVHRAVATTVVMLGFLLILLGLVTLGAVILVNELNSLAQNLPEYMRYLQRQFEQQTAHLQARLDRVPPEAIEEVQRYLTQAVDTINAWLKDGVFMLFNLVKGVPFRITQWVVHWGLAVIIAFFFSLEYDRFREAFHTRAPGTLRRAVRFLQENVLSGLGRYVKAQFKIVSITAMIIFVGMILLRMPNAFFVALLSGIADFVPILGISSLFLPWIGYHLIVGDFRAALWVTVLYAVVVVVRQIVEPRIVGESLGVSPFTMLAAIIVSTSLFGAVGIFVAPVVVILIKALIEQGYFARWIRWPEDR